MLPKNLARYAEKFKDISSNQFERVRKYLSEHKFNKRDIKQFDEEMKKVLKKKKNTIKIVLDILPEPTPRPRLSHGMFYVKNANSNNKFMEVLVRKESDIFHLIDSPCELIVRTYHPIPKAFSKVKTILAELGLIRPDKKPDWDNLGKTYSDMIQKWIISDDAIIIDGEVHKYYSLKPRVEITISYQN